MRASLTLTIRLGVMLAFVVLMPLLALPQVNRWVDENYLGIDARTRSKFTNDSLSSLAAALKRL